MPRRSNGIAEVNRSYFVDDGNEGLVLEVLAVHQKWQIALLQLIYSKISLAEIRAKTKSAETGAALPSNDDVEVLIQGMIQSGMIAAAIHKPANGGPAYLEFLPPATGAVRDRIQTPTRCSGGAP